MVPKAHVKLVTIVAPYELRDRLESDLQGLGATGYTVSRADGRGAHGARTGGVFKLGNVRMEAIVSPAVAEAILEHLERQAEDLEVVGFAQDIEAVPAKQFA
jgi:nitrogen regulatory protein PII